MERAEFPVPLIEKLKSTGLLHNYFKSPYGNKEVSTFAKGVLAAELARVDAGVATFLIVQYITINVNILDGVS